MNAPPSYPGMEWRSSLVHFVVSETSRELSTSPSRDSGEKVAGRGCVLRCFFIRHVETPGEKRCNFGSLFKNSHTRWERVSNRRLYFLAGSSPRSRQVPLATTRPRSRALWTNSRNENVFTSSLRRPNSSTGLERPSEIDVSLERLCRHTRYGS